MFGAGLISPVSLFDSGLQTDNHIFGGRACPNDEACFERSADLVVAVSEKSEMVDHLVGHNIPHSVAKFVIPILSELPKQLFHELLLFG